MLDMMQAFKLDNLRVKFVKLTTKDECLENLMFFVSRFNNLCLQFIKKAKRFGKLSDIIIVSLHLLFNKDLINYL